MNAGRQMDMLIAEKVLGWAPDGAWMAPCYSTDLALAFDALTALGGIVKITRMAPDEWHVVIGAVTCWAETLPLAICRALIVSVESKVAA